jgi:hypothetical protein
MNQGKPKTGKSSLIFWPGRPRILDWDTNDSFSTVYRRP